MSQPPTDIVRELHGAADRAGLVCTKTGNFRAAMIDAAHLRAAAAEIERLRAERDEARRVAIALQVQQQHESGYPNYLKETEWQTGRRIARERGWDCFKEGT